MSKKHYKSNGIELRSSSDIWLALNKWVSLRSLFKTALHWLLEGKVVLKGVAKEQIKPSSFIISLFSDSAQN